MKAIAAILVACTLSGAIVALVMLRGPAAAWWTNPAPLTVLAATVGLVVAIMAPRRWWRT